MEERKVTVSKYVNEIWSRGLCHCDQHKTSFQMMS